MISKPAEIDFEQSMLSIFDDKKATNFIQFVMSDNVSKLHIRNMIKPANIPADWYQDLQLLLGFYCQSASIAYKRISTNSALKGSSYFNWSEKLNFFFAFSYNLTYQKYIPKTLELNSKS